MGFFDLLKGVKPGTSKSEVLKTRHTDAFADSILLELKSVATDAIKMALEERENKFMRSILDESYFLLDSLIIIPKDREIAKRFDDFLSTHESVDPEFRNLFFRQVIQKEYRSLRGGSVRVASDFSPTVQLGQSSLESVTSEEGFQISIKGRRILFEAQASLSGPLKKEAPVRVEKNDYPEPSFTSNNYATSNTAAPRYSPLVTSGSFIQIKLLDAAGVTVHNLSLPLTLGREHGNNETIHSGWSDLRVNATYVSRQQLIFIDILGECYFYVPEAASLSCMRADGSVLEKMKLYKLAPNTHESLNLGIDTNEAGPPLRPQGTTAEYGAIDFSLTSVVNDSSSLGTPRPRALL